MKTCNTCAGGPSLGFIGSTSGGVGTTSAGVGRGTFGSTSGGVGTTSGGVGRGTFVTFVTTATAGTFSCGGDGFMGGRRCCNVAAGMLLLEGTSTGFGSGRNSDDRYKATSTSLCASSSIL